MPDQVAMSFQKLVFQIQFKNPISVLRKPFHIKRNLSLARRITHPAWDNEFPTLSVIADEDLVGRKDHIFEVSYRINSFDRETSTAQRIAQRLPLMLRPDRIDGLSHVGILAIPNFKVGWRTQQYSCGHLNVLLPHQEAIAGVIANQ